MTDLPFSWDGDLAEATLETDEALGCYNADRADRSVWFAWTVPDDGTMRIVVGGATGVSEPESDTNAAIFGPFDGVPTVLPSLDDLRFCVNGTGDEHNLIEGVGGGQTYLLQLSAVSSTETHASIAIQFEGAAHPVVDIAGMGGVSRIAGFARVSVGIACLYDRPFHGWVSINQRLTRTTMAKGNAELFGTCTAETSWYDVYVGPWDHVPFGSGWAEVDLYLEVYGELRTDTAYVVEGVRLRTER